MARDYGIYGKRGRVFELMGMSSLIDWPPDTQYFGWLIADFICSSKQNAMSSLLRRLS